MAGLLEKLFECKERVGMHLALSAAVSVELWAHFTVLFLSLILGNLQKPSRAAGASCLPPGLTERE